MDQIVGDEEVPGGWLALRRRHVGGDPVFEVVEKAREEIDQREQSEGNA
jgi:hypothetical protein